MPTEPDNLGPSAGFSSSCTDLGCNFTDTSSDSDGSIVAWAWDFGDGHVSSAQNPAHSYAAAGSYTVTLTVTDNDDASDPFSDSVTVSDPVLLVDHAAEADLPSAGTVSGSYLNTHADDNSVQSIRERESGGKKNSRYSYLSHTWRFTVSSASTVTVIANAWSGGSADGDTFEFEWSDDNSTFERLFIVSDTDPSQVHSTVIAASGTLYIRVQDTDQTAGNRALDTVFIDQLIIRGDSSVPDNPPVAPDNLQVGSPTSTTLQLSWDHDSTDEQGFDLQRRLTGGSTWIDIPGIGGGSTGYTDTGLNPSTSYDYQIRAVNAAGPAPGSEIATWSTSAAADITMSANGYKVKGKQKVDLSWSGAGSIEVDIVRDREVIDTVPNAPGSYTDHIDAKGGATYTYEVCEAGTSDCSDDAVVVF